MLTQAGKTVLALGVTLLILGWAFQYRPLVGIAIAFLVAILIAIAQVARPPRLDVDRVVEPQRVLAGGSSTDELRLTNTGRRATRRGVGIERFGDGVIAVHVPALQPGESITVRHELPTERRGVYPVGPLELNRSDPLSLARRGTWRSETAELIVHPVVHDVDPFPSGLSRDLDGPNSGEAPEGGVAFMNLREYVEGDDLRLIHWRSSARSDKLMVRHNVDSHQPRSLILLDTRRSVYHDDAFEDAVRCAASIAVASRKRNFPYRLQSTGGLRIDQSIPSSQMLDELAAVTLTEQIGAPLYDMVRAASRDRGGFSLTLITGQAPMDDLVQISPLRNRFEKITIGRLGPSAANEAVDLPGAVLINAPSSTDFARSWNKRVRR